LGSKEEINIKSYADIREAHLEVQLNSLKKIEEVFRSEGFPDVTFECLNQNLLDKWIEWQSRLKCWNNLFSGAQRIRPRHFSLGIFDDKKLYGMAFGRLSKGRRHLRIDYLEARPRPHKYEGMVAQMAILSALEYAKDVGAKKLLITNPLPGTEKVYDPLCDGFVKPSESSWPRGHYFIHVRSTT